MTPLSEMTMTDRRNSGRLEAVFGAGILGLWLKGSAYRSCEGPELPHQPGKDLDELRQVKEKLPDLLGIENVFLSWCLVNHCIHPSIF